jgi:hypothetical protein
MTKGKGAFLFASQTLGKQKLFLWTFTFKELLAVKETRKRWNHLLTLLQREWRADRDGTGLLDTGGGGAAIIGDSLRDFCSSPTPLGELSRVCPAAIC